MSRRKHSLHVITTGRQELAEIASILQRCPTELVDVLHIREKQRSARELVEWYTKLRPLLPKTTIVLNDRLDAALAAKADGVQLGVNSLTADQARVIAPQGMTIGCSVHSPEEASEAARQGADYVIFGHVYSTQSKPDLPPRGIALLAETIKAASLPVIAIGGIEPMRVEEVLSTGAAGIAVLSSVLLHQHPAEQIIAFREAMDQTQHIPRREFS